LAINAHTVATHMGNAWRKWVLAARLEGAVWLWKHGLVEEDRAAGGNPLENKVDFQDCQSRPHVIRWKHHRAVRWTEISNHTEGR